MGGKMDINSGGIRAHLLDELLPLWAERGRDRKRGGYYTSLGLGLKPSESEPKRLLTQARQTYVFSHACLLGAGKWALEAAQHGFGYLRQKFWDAGNGGWISSVEPGGEPRQTRKDTYDHAFVLFAMAYYYRVTKEPEALSIAARTLELLDAKLGDKHSGGFLEGAAADWSPVDEPRRQNPHMHLLEAFLALYETTREDLYLEHARRIITLFKERFFDSQHGVLGEYFDREWRVAPEKAGEIVEPGHHFEWVWLLHQFARAARDESVLQHAKTLYEFALRHGVDPQDHGVFDRVNRTGEVLGDRKRVWPHTECLKACGARYEGAKDADALETLRAVLDRCFGLYVHPEHRGWKEVFSRAGRLESDEMPATSVYHIVLGLSETARVLRAV